MAFRGSKSLVAPVDLRLRSAGSPVDGCACLEIEFNKLP